MDAMFTQTSVHGRGKPIVTYREFGPGGPPLKESGTSFISLSIMYGRQTTDFTLESRTDAVDLLGAIEKAIKDVLYPPPASSNPIQSMDDVISELNRMVVEDSKDTTDALADIVAYLTPTS